MKWITFAESFPLDSKSCSGVLSGLNEDLAQKSVLLGTGLKPSEADVIVFAVLHPLLVWNLTFHLIHILQKKMKWEKRRKMKKTVKFCCLSFYKRKNGENIERRKKIFIAVGHERKSLTLFPYNFFFKILFSPRWQTN